MNDDDYNYMMMMEMMILVAVAKNCVHGLLAASGPLSKLTPTTCKATRRSKKGPKREEGEDGTILQEEIFSTRAENTRRNLLVLRWIFVQTH